MERHVKERLIGACILVVLVVAVVPELLSGPKPAPVSAASASDLVRLPAGTPEPVRNVTVDLATSKPAAPEATAAAAAPPPNAVDTAPPSGAAPSVAAPMPTPPAPVPVTPAPTVASAAPPALETPAPLPTSGHEWAVQLGSFANRSNADKLVHQLKAQGFAIYMNAEGSGNAARYRVRVGPLADRDAAERTIAKLKSMGHSASIISPR